MSSKSDQSFWKNLTIAATAITAALVAVGTFLDMPGKLREAANEFSGSDPEQVALPSETSNGQDVKVDASSKVNTFSGNPNAVANPETNIEIGSPSMRMDQSPTIENRSSATYGSQYQNVIFHSEPFPLGTELSNNSSQLEIIADLPQPLEQSEQSSTQSAGISQSSDGSVLSPNFYNSSGNSINVGGDVRSEVSSDTYNGTVYNGDVCEGAIGSSCAPESLTENDFSGANITGNSSQ